MIRPALAAFLALAALLIALPGLAGAEPPAVVGPPRAAEPRAAPEPPAPCRNTGGPDNCSRVLACVGDDGLWFDGRSIGWNRGTLEGSMSDGTACVGDWGERGWFGLSMKASVRCEDGRSGDLLYTAQDPESGTGIGSGTMSDGAEVRAWTGRNVLRFLTGEDGVPRLPCEAGAIPIS